MKKTLAAAVLAAITPLLSAPIQAEPRWGPEDQIGAANLVTQASVLAASGLITTGKTYALGMIIDDKIPAYPPRKLGLTIVQPNQIDSKGHGPTMSSYNDDVFSGWLGIGSQIDGLGHVGRSHEYYNGHKGADFAQPGGLTKLGVENIPPIVARGVVLDIAGLKGKPVMDAGEVITPQDIQAAAAAQNVELREGDVVLLHTGWLSLLTGENTDPARYGRGEPGIDPAAAAYLAELGAVAVGADTWGVEAVPFAPGAGVFEAHQVLLKDHGVYILENMVTEELVADGVDEFLFVLGVTRLRGAVQMMINPVAIR
ncbi:cyclase family protein [Thalassobius sp. S69A]|uniref:cyclase family protein n=1 Tax=unclassified Thalassovita TaxID=2619711 RepID=UPI000C0F6DA4|nr:polyketide cyclase [Paracoccaceae bacterium]MBT27068.1 polyketide cyclase [Paracoccaceae bacterium]